MRGAVRVRRPVGLRRVLACTWEPIITQYIHEIGRIDAEPHGADAIAPNESVHVPSAFSIGITGEFGRYGLRWAATPIGPTPGPGVGGRWRCEVEVVVGVVEAALALTAAAVGDAERLVQVQVADVGAEVAGAAQPDLRVHVGAVHVHLAAVLVDDVAHLGDRLLEDAVRRRVRDHQRRELRGARW